jgi:sugar fermentation stimulation protein A
MNSFRPIMNKITFSEPLTEGMIKSRPNRFIMIVEVAGQTYKCHCPSTGRIGDVVFSDISCLVSKAKDSERKTPYTVEAISLDSKEKKKKSWIGINQNKSNNYVEYFLKKEMLTKMISNGKNVVRERQLGKSRIDFQIGNDFVEVKTPLITLPGQNTAEKMTHSKFNSFDRLIKHFKDLGKNLKPGSRAIILMCYMYDAAPFVRPAQDKDNKKIIRAAQKANKSGVENWQINMKIDETGVELLKYFRLELF